MLTSSLGHVSVTEVDGTAFTGLYAADGSLNVYDATSDTVPNGLYHPCGAMNITITDGTTLTGRYANNGSLYVVIDSTQYGVYHSCGAMNITGIAVSNAVSFLAEYGPYGMVMDFTDASIAINDVTDVLNYNSIGQVSSGALIGPGAKLTYIAPSVKLTEQADGLLKFQAHNLFTWSEDFSNAAWLKTNVSASGNVLTATGVSANKFIRQNVMTAAGPSYGISFDVAAGTHSRVQIYSDTPTTAFANFNLSSGTVTLVGTDVVASITAIGGGVYRCTAEFPIVGTNARLAFIDSDVSPWGAASASTGTIIVSRAHLRRTPSASDYIATTAAAAYDLPYVYSSGVRTGIMVEPAATNLCTRSSSLVSPWSIVSITPTANAVAGLSGAMNADEVTINAGSSGHYAQFNLTWTAAVHTTYAIVRYRNHPFLQITSWDGTSSRYCNFNISDGTIGSASGMTGAIISLGGSTYLVAATSTTNMAAAGGNVTLAAIPASTSGANATWTAAGTEKYDFLHFQIETGTVATSPIITYGSTVLRAADDITQLTSAFPCTFPLAIAAVFRSYTPNNDNVVYGVAQIDDGTLANRVAVYKYNGTVGYVVTSASAAQATQNISAGLTIAGEEKRIAVRAKLNDVRPALDGVLGLQDGTASMPVSFPTLRLGRYIGGTHLNGLLVRLIVVPRDVTDAELTTFGEPL